MRITKLLIILSFLLFFACSTQEDGNAIDSKKYKDYSYKLCALFQAEEIIEAFDLQDKKTVDIDYIKMISINKKYDASIDEEYPMVIFDKECLKLRDEDHAIELLVITERGEDYSLRYGVYATETGEVRGIEVRHFYRAL